MKFVKKCTLLSIASLIAIMSIAAYCSAQDKTTTPGKVASVNDVIITQKLLDEELTMLKNSYARSGKPIPENEMDNIRKKILEDLINQELLFQESKKEGIKVKKEAVAERVSAFKKQFPDENAYQKALNDLNMTLQDLENRIARYFAIKEVIDTKITKDVTVPETETRTYYDTNAEKFKRPEQVKASHILIKVAQDADDDQKTKAREKIEAVQKKLKEGSDFAEMAKTFSEGPSKTNGGNLGFFKRGQMVKPFEDAAFALKKDEISDVVETRFGYHLIKLTDKNPAGTLGYDEMKDKIANRLKEEKKNTIIMKHLDDLRKAAKIEKFL